MRQPARDRQVRQPARDRQVRQPARDRHVRQPGETDSQQLRGLHVQRVTPEPKDSQTDRQTDGQQPRALHVQLATQEAKDTFPPHTVFDARQKQREDKLVSEVAAPMCRPSDILLLKGAVSTHLALRG